MDLRELQRHWDTFGRRDPFWAILTDPAKRGNRWRPDEFFETGRTEVDELLTHARRLGVPRSRRHALDFGCGAGRLTQALAAQFDTALGVDVAPSMIDLARTHNRFGDRCTYTVNDQPNLSRWPDGRFDLIYTSRVLQHIAPQYASAYVGEFVRLLAPGGYLSFDLPSASGDAVAEADGSVPTTAMRAGVRLSPAAPTFATPGAPLRFTVTVANLSDRPWHDAPGRALNLGNHWASADGAMLQQDDVRVKVPTPLAPGAEAQVPLEVNAPLLPGTYRLQVDLVQEGVAWFASCGSELAELALTVVEAGLPPVRQPEPMSAPHGFGGAADLASNAPPPGDVEPVMEMHAIERSAVEAILREAGARLLDTRRVYHCGPQWLAFRYDVTKEK